MITDLPTERMEVFFYSDKPFSEFHLQDDGKNQVA